MTKWLGGAYCIEAFLISLDLEKSRIYLLDHLRTLPMDSDEWDVAETVSAESAAPIDQFDRIMRLGVERCSDTAKLIKWHRIVSVSSNESTILQFLADNSNPRMFLGMLSNVGTFLFSGALNQNCVICAKAVDLSLSSLLGRGFSAGSSPADFWIAKQITPGSLLFLRDTLSVTTRNLTDKSRYDHSVAAKIFSIIPIGKRAMIAVPVRGKSFLHALNAVHLKDGTKFLIDGQFGKIYHGRDWAAVDRRFRLPVVGAIDDATAAVYIIGDAPDFAALETTRASLLGYPSRVSFVRD